VVNAPFCVGWFRLLCPFMLANKRS
jgi:hypothetical protein